MKLLIFKNIFAVLYHKVFRVSKNSFYVFVSRMHQNWTKLKPESSLSPSSSSELEIISFLFRRLGQDWFVRQTSCGHSSGPWVVAGGDVTRTGDQALTTSDPHNDAGDRSELAKIDKIQHRTIGRGRNCAASGKQR